MFSCDEVTSAQTKQNKINVQNDDITIVNGGVKREQPDECIIELQSSNVLEDPDDEPIETPKKTVICTDDEFERDFGGVVKSEVLLGDYEFDGAIKSEVVTYEQKES